MIGPKVRRLLEVLGIAAAALRARRGRAVAATAPIVLGVAAIIAVTGFLAGAERSLDASLRRFGADNLVVTPTDSGGPDGPAKLPGDTVARLESVPTVVAATPMTELPEAVVARSRVADPLDLDAANALVVSTDSTLIATAGLRVEAGRFLNDFDAASGTRVAVLGSDLASAFATDLAATPAVLIGGEVFGVVGVLAPSAVLPSLNRTALVPSSTAAALWADDGRPSQVLARVAPGTAQGTAAILPVALGLGRAAPVVVDLAGGVLRAEQEVDQTFAVVLLIAAAITLAVAGLGIGFAQWNAVASRTPEIGIRRALGATRVDVALVFLIETAIVGVAGAVIGAAAGVGAVFAIAAVENWEAVLQPASWALVALLAVEVGTVAGLLPAVRAARLEPTAALRHL